MVQEAVENTTT